MNKLILLASIISFNLSANDTSIFGRIISVKGEGFISYEGKTHELKKGEVVKNKSEIVIEHKGQVVLIDEKDHKFILSNSTSVYVSNSTLELRSGDVWLQSLNKNDESTIQTANSMIKYNGGEAIISYDSEKSKTQLMVINGTMNISNVNSRELNLTVAEGHFSFVDNTYDQGAPRDPTPVGEKTYKDLISLFEGVKPMDAKSEHVFKQHVVDIPAHEKHETPKNVERGIASVNKEIAEPKILEEYKNSLIEGKKVHAGTDKVVAAHKVVKKKSMTNKTSHGPKLQNTIVQIYGRSVPKKIEINTTSNRAPASVMDAPVINEVEIENPYKVLLNKQNKESEDLIKKIQSLDMK